MPIPTQLPILSHPLQRSLSAHTKTPSHTLLFSSHSLGFMDIQPSRSFDHIHCLINSSTSSKSQSPNPIFLSPSIAATKIAAFVKGTLVRNKTVLPNQISSLLHQKLPELSDSENQNLATLFCQTINKMSQDMSYRGKTILVNGFSAPNFSNNGTFKVEEARNTHSGKDLFFKAHYDYRVELSSAGTSIRLLIIPKVKSPKQPDQWMNQFLGKGGFKNVFALHEIMIPLIFKNGKRAVVYHPQTLQQIASPDRFEKVKPGLSIQRQLSESETPEHEIMEPPQQLLFVEDAKTPPSTVELTQPWYNLDFAHAIRAEEVPLTFAPNSDKLKLSFDGVLNIFMDVASQLIYIHSKNCVHGDVKLTNILVKIPEGESLNPPHFKGILSDYDLTRYHGSLIDNAHPYPYWDTLARDYSINTPFSDIYGLAIALLTFLVPHFSLNGALSYRLLANYSEFYKKAHEFKKNSDFKEVENFERIKTKTFNHFAFEIHKTFLDLLQTTICGHKDLKKKTWKSIKTHLLAQPGSHSLMKILNFFISSVSLLTEEEIQILKNLKKEIAMREALASLAFGIIKQDLVRVEKVAQTMVENRDDPTHWSRSLEKTDEEEALLDKDVATKILTLIKEVPAFSAEDFYGFLQMLKDGNTDTVEQN